MILREALPANAIKCRLLARCESMAVERLVSGLGVNGDDAWKVRGGLKS
jgi:hypothetical protein